MYGIETTPFGPLQWTSNDAVIEMRNSSPGPATHLVLALWPMPLSAGARLIVAVNGISMYDDAVPTQTVTLPLQRFSADQKLVVTLRTNVITRYRNDPREFGIAIKEMKLRKNGRQTFMTPSTGIGSKD